MKTFIITYLMNLMTDLHPGHFRRRRRRRRKRKRRRKRRKEDKERRRRKRRRRKRRSVGSRPHIRRYKMALTSCVLSGKQIICACAKGIL